jgi:hypothetical protein
MILQTGYFFCILFGNVSGMGKGRGEDSGHLFDFFFGHKKLLSLVHSVFYIAARISTAPAMIKTSSIKFSVR